tara:strand:+ start:208 stop:432 length:225 start_codon:yes stop_codon:yes gene_type:complete
MTKAEYKDLSIQRSFDLERAVEKIEKQEALISHLRETIIHYSQRVNMYEKKVDKLRKSLGEEMDTMSNIKNLLK